MNKTLSRLLCASFLLVLSFQIVFAAPSECVTVGYGSNMDDLECSRVDQGNPNSPYGCYLNVFISEENGEPDIDGMVSFDFDFYIDNLSINYAKLSFEFEGYSASYSDGYVKIAEPTSAFDTCTVTYNQQPGYTSTIWTTSLIDESEEVIESITTISDIEKGFHGKSAYYKLVADYDADDEMAAYFKCHSNRQTYLQICYTGQPIYCISGECCDTQTGQYKTEGTSCGSIENATCDTHNTSLCDGHAYQAQCTGDSEVCPTEKYQIDYDTACSGLDAGVCAECTGGSTPEADDDHDDCDYVDCSVLNTSCRVYDDIQLCLDVNQCVNSTQYCTAYTNMDEGTPCGVNGECNSYGLCVGEGYEFEYDFIYDLNGNLIKDNQNYYEYNYFNQLVRVRLDNATGSLLEEYAYDADGQRVKKVAYASDGSNETTLYVNPYFVVTINDSGVYNTTYYYAGAELVAEKRSNGEKLYYHPDHLGSTSLVTNQSGDVVEEIKYKPFGGVLSESFDSRYTYEGKESDSTGLLDFKARAYNPYLRMFTQPDTIIQNVYDPQSLNRYSFERNNPYNNVDPTGEFICGGLCIGAVTLATTTSPYWAPYVGAYFINDDLTDMKNAYEEPSPSTLFWAGLALADFTPGNIIKQGTKGIGKIGGKVLKFLGKADNAVEVAKTAEIVKDISQTQFRTNLIKATGELGIGKEAHHIIPKTSARRDLFNRRGFSNEFINSVDNAMWVQKGHGTTWNAYEKRLIDYMMQNPFASSNQILDEAKRITRDMYG